MKVNIKDYVGMRSKKERTVKVEIQDWDTWSLDHTLALVILPALVKFREELHGGPLVDDEDVPEDLRSTSDTTPKKNEWDVDVFYFDRWRYVLDQMIWSFNEIVENNDQSYYVNGIYNQEYNDKIANGLRLFGRYYRALWN